jgi:hypothetical protein
MYLKNKLEETVKNYECQFQKINEDNEIILKKIKTDKELELKNLILKNKDLEEMNKDLIIKNNDYTMTMQKIKVNFNEKMSEFDLEKKQKDKEIFDLKNFYEERISYLINSFNVEKNRINSENDQNIEKYLLLFLLF